MSELMTVAEVAAVLKVSEDTVTRRFSSVKGVIDLGSPETPRRRRYRVLRIPKAVVEKYLTAKGSPITIEVPTIRKTRRSDWETKTAQDLVALMGQHGDEARKTLEKITRMARMMTFVPENMWDQIYLIDDEDRTLNTISNECEAGECAKCPRIILDSGMVAEEVICVHGCHRVTPTDRVSDTGTRSRKT